MTDESKDKSLQIKGRTTDPTFGKKVKDDEKNTFNKPEFDFKYYCKEVEKILLDVAGPDYLTNDDIDGIVEVVYHTILLYDKFSLKKLKLKSIIRKIVLSNLENIYVMKGISRRKVTQKGGSSNPFEVTFPFMNRAFDYPFNKYQEDIYKIRLNRVIELKGRPQPEQKSPEWFAAREKCLTGTAIASALNEDPYGMPIKTLLEKCGVRAIFEDSIFTHHGKKYEQIANMHYCYRNNVSVAEYGLLAHDKYSYLAASPDGICDKNTLLGSSLSKLVGRLLEIKCPFRRKIQTEGEIDGDICPHYYWIQVQMQLEVTDLDECDFLQCQIEEYFSREEFIKDTNPQAPFLSNAWSLEKGAIIQLLPKVHEGKEEDRLFKAKYIYPPRINMSVEEIDSWIVDVLAAFHREGLSKDFYFDRVIYWKFVKVHCVLLKRDRNWFAKNLPNLKQFWEYIKFYRKNPNKIKELVDFLQTVYKTSFTSSDDLMRWMKDNNKKDKPVEIFEFVQRQYQSVEKENSKYNKQLYIGKESAAHGHGHGPKKSGDKPKKLLGDKCYFVDE